MYVCVYVWMDGWMAGWMDGWMDGWMNGWLAGWMDGDGMYGPVCGGARDPESGLIYIYIYICVCVENHVFLQTQIIGLNSYHFISTFARSDLQTKTFLFSPTHHHLQCGASQLYLLACNTQLLYLCIYHVMCIYIYNIIKYSQIFSTV